jgi:long-chain acyl-CoA synthetase
VCQGYGMTEASPVTHVGYLEPELYRPDSIGHPLAQTECRVIGAENLETSTGSGEDVPVGEPGELVMRGPQFTRGYWKDPEASAAVLRDGWYWSGDVVTRDSEGFYRVVDRRKEMIKYKGFPVAPAEVEAVLLEHPAVRECGVVGGGGGDSRRVRRVARGIRDRQKVGRRIVRVRCRPPHALQAAARGAFRGNCPQDGVG